MATTTSTLPQHWKYVSEGGATIVFTYVGPPHPQYTGMVLRLRKASTPTECDRAGEVQEKTDEPDEPDDPSIEFQKKCMERLIPSDHLPRLESTHVDRDWLEALAALHEAERPDERREKDHIDLNRTKAVLATDLVGGNWLAVEIKPKWGFLPSSLHLSETTRGIKTQTCRFCMHAHMRARQGEDLSVGYCPLDLFSNDEDRMSSAIHALWDAWDVSNGTINNLKIFKSGRLIHPSDKSLLQEGLDVSSLGTDLRDAFTSVLLRVLMRTPVLRILSKLQRTLDVLDIEGLSKLWRSAELSAGTYSDQPSLLGTASNSPLGMSYEFWPSGMPTMSDWADFLDTYLSPISSKFDHSQPAPGNLRYYLEAYLLSATFKDCSVIIRLDSLSLKGRPTEAVKPDRVTVIDLDPKSVHRLQNWEKLDEEITQGYLDVDKPKRCIDGWMEHVASGVSVEKRLSDSDLRETKLSA